MKKLLIVFIFNILFFIVFILWFFNHYMDFLFFLDCICIIIFSFLFILYFWKYTNTYPKNVIFDYETFHFKVTSQILQKQINIEFYYNQGKWRSTSFESNLTLDLSGYIFQKSFINAYITRQLRYKTYNATNKKLRWFFRRRMKIDGFQNVNIYVFFRKNGVCTNKKIVKNGVSVCPFISRVINYSKYYKDILLAGPLDGTRTLMNNTSKYNEKKYNNHI